MYCHEASLALSPSNSWEEMFIEAVPLVRPNIASPLPPLFSMLLSQQHNLIPVLLLSKPLQSGTTLPTAALSSVNTPKPS